MLSEKPKRIIFRTAILGEEELKKSLDKQNGDIQIRRLPLTPKRFYDIIFAPDKQFKLDIWTPEEKEFISEVMKKL